MYVVTFYSFKGGVGRTLALLNVAYEIADSGQRVLVVDFDLEAPAIRPDRWKQGANDEESDQVGRGPTDAGVVEFVTCYLETMRVPPVSDYIVDANPEGCQGHLAVMSAGAVDGTYGQRLNAIDWSLLYAARDGYVMFEDVRAQWQAAGFDYVLLDSRTGFTDVGGICTRHLPDAVVSLFRPDDQSLGGTAQMAEAILAEVPTPRRAHDIEQHFVMAGIPDADDEHGHLARRRRVFVERLGIPGHDRLTEIKHYSSMDLLTHPIYTMERRGTRLAKSYLALTRKIRARNVGDRGGVLDGLRDRHLRRHTDYLDRVGKRYRNDSEVLAMVAEAYEREGDLLEAAQLLDNAFQIGHLTLRQVFSLARSRHLTGDLDGALQALRSFFDGPAEPNGEIPRALVLAALDLLQLLGAEDAGGIVADSPVIAGAPPSTRAAVAFRLDRSVSERRTAIAILEKLIATDDAVGRERDRWSWQLAFARMAVGDVGRAAAFFEDAMADPVQPVSVPTAFNAAMADWATAGVPSRDSFRKVLETIDADADKPWMPGHANALQSVSVARWFAGYDEDATKSLAEAEGAAGRHEVSCWSYTRVSREAFLGHCAEIRRLFNGEDVLPVFIRTREPSGEPGRWRGATPEQQVHFTTGGKMLQPIETAARDGSPVAQLKRYLSERRYRIRLSDLVDETVERVAVELSSDVFSAQHGEVTSESVTTRIRQYEATSSILLEMACVGGRWAEEEHFDIWRRAIQRLYSCRSRESGKVAWLDMQRYPATLLLYALGLGAIEGNRLAFLRHILCTPLRDSGTEEHPAVQILPPRKLDTHDAAKMLEGMERRYYPLNDWLHNTLQGVAVHTIRDPQRYTLLFDKLEILIALAFAQYGTPFLEGWMPCGAFHYRYQGGNRERVLTEIRESLAADGEKSPFVVSGIFGHSVAECEARVEQLTTFLAKHPIW